MTIKEIADNGVIGAGGGGFPAAVKLASRPDVLIMNAAECEPLLHKDISLLEGSASKVLDGFSRSLKITGAQKGIIGIKKKHAGVIKSLERVLDPRMEIIPLDDFYPAGDEVTLVEITTGRRIEPGALPISAGAVVMNVETLFNIGAGKPVVDKYLTVAGAVTEPKTLVVPVGASYADVLANFSITANRFVLRIGGLMMGILEKNMDGVVTKRTGGIIVLPADHKLVESYERYSCSENTIRTGKTSCDQCSFCMDLCPRYLAGWPVRPERAMRNMMFGSKRQGAVHMGNEFCCECNLCTQYSCPEGLDPRGATMMEKSFRRQQSTKWEGLQVQAHPMKDFRRVPLSRLKQRLDVVHYDRPAPLDGQPVVVNKARILLGQHAGSPAIPVVERGTRIKRGELIAKANGNISAPLHASIDGTVTEVNDNEIIIQR